MAETGEFKDRYIKLDGTVSFGRDVSDEKGKDNRDKEGWLLFSEDKKVSRSHFSAKVNQKQFCVEITDFGSKLGTWLALMNDVEEQIIPEVQYKSSYLNGFRFQLGMRSDTIEEVLDSFDRLDLIDTFIALDLNSIEKVINSKLHHIHSILDSLEVLENGQKDIVGAINRIKNDFKG